VKKELAKISCAEMDIILEFDDRHPILCHTPLLLIYIILSA